MRDVGEIMNPEIFSLRGEEPAQEALHYLRTLGIASAPVLDQQRYPIGVAAWSDLAAANNGERVRDVMKPEPLTVDATDHIRTAARMLAESGQPCLVVVNELGRAVGIVSAIDVMRGLAGFPSSHPAAFPHIDAATLLSWSDPKRLRSSAVNDAPRRAGIIALLVDSQGAHTRTVWFEAATDLHARLRELAFGHGRFPESVGAWHGTGELEFRYAVEPDASERDRLVELLWDTADRPTPDLRLAAKEPASPGR